MHLLFYFLCYFKLLTQTGRHLCNRSKLHSCLHCCLPLAAFIHKLISMLLLWCFFPLQCTKMSPFYAYVQTDGFMTDWHTDQWKGRSSDCVWLCKDVVALCYGSVLVSDTIVLFIHFWKQILFPSISAELLGYIWLSCHPLFLSL